MACDVSLCINSVCGSCLSYQVTGAAKVLEAPVTKKNMQLCAHCLALTVPAATVGSFDPASHFRSRMCAALRRDSIHGQYARPRDYYAALFAPDIPLDDESFTAAGCTVALTQGFLLRPCHLQLPLWLATSLLPVPFLRECFDILHGWLDLDHASPEGLGDTGTHARCGRRLTLATGFVMVPRMLGVGVASRWQQDLSWCRPCLGLFLG